jgi:peptidoglycan/xylan/chitin deacetylase (PgdA/CDA1 family)
MILNGHIYKNFEISQVLNFKNKFCSATDTNEDLASNKLFPITWTFDDGLSDLLIIDKFLTDIGNIKFRFFISPYLIETKVRTNIKFIKSKLRIETKPLLTWEQVGRLTEKGHILGLHGYDHTDLNLLSKNQIIENFESSIELLKKRISIKTNSFAFPFGRINTNEKLLTNSQIIIAKKFFSRIYLSDNRMATFGDKGVYNRRYAEFDNIIYINLIKGFLQNFRRKFFFIK